MRGFSIIYYLIPLMVFFSCQELYNPEVVEIDHGFLVVEGFVEVGGGETLIKLGKTTTVYSEQSLIPVSKASIVVEGSREGQWFMEHKEDGIYALTADLPTDQNYKLFLQVNEVDRYESEWMEPLISSDISDLYFEREEEGVFIYLDSEGSRDQAFSLWTTEEAWQFRTVFTSSYKYDHETFEMVPRQESINICFREEKSSRFTLASSTNSIDGGFRKLEVMRIPLFSEKLGIRYSIEVTQKQVDQRAFEFWGSMRKNTEDVGGIFSPMPSILGSNLRKVGAEEVPVIGYVSAGKSSKKRIYIQFPDVRPWVVKTPDYDHCTREPISQRTLEGVLSGERLPLEPVPFEEGLIFQFDSAPKFCADCRERGTLEKPDFWE
jgi:hypothetical protein